MFNIHDFVKNTPKHTRYRRQIERITGKNGYTENIEKAVNGAIENIDSGC